MKLGRHGDGGRGSFGLSLMVKRTKDSTLGRYWHQRYRQANGKYTTRTLGTYPAVSLEQARAMAAHHALQGEEPFTPVRREIQAAVTLPPATATASLVLNDNPTAFRRVYFQSLASRARGFRSGSKTERQARALFAAYISRELADRPIEEVVAADLIASLAEVWHDKPSTADKLIQHLGGCFNYALVHDLIPANPLDKAKLGLGRRKRKDKHFPALPFADVSSALAVVEESGAHASTRHAFAFLTLTACRSGEVRGATWEEMDLDAATWTIPAERTKTGRAHRVPLSSGALAILRTLSGTGDGLVFPSARGRVQGDNAMSTMLRDNGVLGVPHGMRSSFRDWAAERTDVPREIAEHALGHVTGDASELAYRRTDYFDKRRELMQAWSDFLARW